jgi:DNA-directed RNA polymerase subunit K/omega
VNDDKPARDLTNLHDVDTIAERAAFGSRFGLVAIVRKRAHRVAYETLGERLERQSRGLTDFDWSRDEKPVTVALEEAASGHLVPLNPPADAQTFKPRYSDRDDILPYTSGKIPLTPAKVEAPSAGPSEKATESTRMLPDAPARRETYAEIKARTARSVEAAAKPVEPPRREYSPYKPEPNSGAGRIAKIVCRVCGWSGTVRRVSGPPQGKPPTLCKEHGLSKLWEPVQP